MAVTQSRAVLRTLNLRHLLPTAMEMHMLFPFAAAGLRDLQLHATPGATKRFAVLRRIDALVILNLRSRHG